MVRTLKINYTHYTETMLDSWLTLWVRLPFFHVALLGDGVKSLCCLASLKIGFPWIPWIHVAPRSKGNPSPLLSSVKYHFHRCSYLKWSVKYHIYWQITQVTRMRGVRKLYRRFTRVFRRYLGGILGDVWEKPPPTWSFEFSAVR